jgi:uncharacterized protein
MSCFSVKGDRLILKVKIGTGAHGNKFCGEKNDELLIQIKAQPEKDKANKELIKFLSKSLEVSRSDIEIITGAHSHHKLITLPKSAESGLIDAGAEKG